MTQNTPVNMLNDNQRRIIGELMRNPNSRRNDLADTLGFSPQTMMRAVNPLVEMNIVTEVDELSGSRGKPPRLMSVRPGSLLTLGITVTEGRNIIDLANIAGQRIGSMRVITEFSSAQDQLDSLLRSIAEISEAHSASGRIVSLAAVVQGYFLTKGRRIVRRSDPQGWAKIDLYDELAKVSGLSPTIVNDGKAFAASLTGVSTSANYMAVFLGTGIGGGVVENGRLLSGAVGNAGEIGRFFAYDETRPTERNLLRTLGRRDWSGWPGRDQISPEEESALENWLDDAAASMKEPLSLALALLDFDRVYIGSKMPVELVNALAAKVSLVPLGAELDRQNEGFIGPAPQVIGQHIPSLSQLATKIAATSFLTPDQIFSDAEEDPFEPVVSLNSKVAQNG